MTKEKLVVSCTSMPLNAMMDSDAQLIMIGKLLVIKLGLTTADLIPCPFTIVILVVGTKHATKEPLYLIFVWTQDLLSHTFVRSMQSWVLPTMAF